MSNETKQSLIGNFFKIIRKCWRLTSYLKEDVAEAIEQNLIHPFFSDSESEFLFNSQ